jgi:dTDP-glucose 4,6-dehydratase
VDRVRNLRISKKRAPGERHCAVIKGLTKSDAKIEFHPLPTDDPERWKPDISKAKNLLQWVPKVKLEGGLKRMIEWFGARN